MDNYYLRFPNTLKKALSSRKIKLPDNLEIEFDSFLAYRGIRFIKNTKEEPNREDFLSQIELKELGKPFYKQYQDDDVENYGTSLFCSKEELIKGLSLPRKNKAIVKGLVNSDLGSISKNVKSKHVLWFLYDNTCPERQFKVIEYYEKVDGSQEYRTIELREDIS